MVDRNGRTKPPCADTFVRRLSLDCFALLAMTELAMRRNQSSFGKLQRLFKDKNELRNCAIAPPLERAD